ncbi:hypothetical protein ACH347_36930 [Saccharopolyspora sp. 5N102]|uniref:hypothetical protein n=1 Tax=Saccharopolyspora sp. 5N102 TaxID=3375155 RepID=UPI0037AD7DB3
MADIDVRTWRVLYDNERAVLTEARARQVLIPPTSTRAGDGTRSPTAGTVFEDQARFNCARFAGSVLFNSGIHFASMALFVDAHFESSVISLANWIVRLGLSESISGKVLSSLRPKDAFVSITRGLRIQFY